MCMKLNRELFNFISNLVSVDEIIILISIFFLTQKGPIKSKHGDLFSITWAEYNGNILLSE